MTLHVEPQIAAYGAFANRVRIVRSPGGIEAWLFEDETLPVVTMSFAFRGGAALDPPGKPGTAQLMASLLTKGAGDLDEAGFDRAIADHAVRLRVEVGQDGLTGQFRTLTRNLDPAVALLRLALNAPNFAPDATTRARATLAASLRQWQSAPKPVSTLAFFARGFGDHPYGRPVVGTLASLDTITRDDLVALHRHMLRRDALRIAVVGAIGPEALGAVLDLVFADLPAGAPAAPPPVVLAGLGERVVTYLDLPQSTICFGRPGITRDDADFSAAHLVNNCLGNGQFTSRLMLEVREKRGLCYAIGSQMNHAVGASTFIGSTSVANARVEETLHVIADEIARLSREGLATGELDQAKRYLIGAYGMNFDTSVSIARLLLGLQEDGRDLSWLVERGRRLAAVTPDDASRVIERLFGDGAMLISIAGNPSLGASPSA